MEKVLHPFIVLTAFMIVIAALGSHLVYAQQTRPVKALSVNEQITNLRATADENLKQKRYLTAAAALQQIVRLTPSDGGNAYNVACAYALAGEIEQAFTWLQKSIDTGYTDVPYMRKDSDLKIVQEDKRFEPLMERAQAEKKRRDRLWDSDVWNTPYQEQLSDEQRIAGLSKLWSEIKYNFVFTERLIELDWDAVYLRYLPQVRMAKDTKTYYRLLMEMSALLHDGHTGVSFPDHLFKTEMAVPPFLTQLIDGKVVVTAIFDDELQAQGVRPGMIITGVNGQSPITYAEQYLAPYTFASTKQNLEVRIYQQMFLAGNITERVQVEFLDADNNNRTLTIQRIGFDERNARMTQAPYEFNMMPGGVAYLALNSFGSDTALTAYLREFPQIDQAKAIIFDLRKNRGGNTNVGYGILKTLSDQPFAASYSQTRDYKPTYRAWGRPPAMMSFDAYIVEPDPNHQYRGQVLVLTSAQTFSAAEDFVIAFDAMKRGKLIGETTGGSTGQPLFISLPGGGSARICTKKDRYANGKPFIGIGVEPNIVTHPTLSDFRAGRDTVLETALKQIE